MAPGCSRAGHTSLHRRQRVVQRPLLRMSPEPRIAAAGGVEPRATHQASFSTVGRERGLSRRSSERSRTNAWAPASGRKLRAGKPSFYGGERGTHLASIQQRHLSQRGTAASTMTCSMSSQAHRESAPGFRRVCRTPSLEVTTPIAVSPRAAACAARSEKLQTVSPVPGSGDRNRMVVPQDWVSS